MIAFLAEANPPRTRSVSAQTDDDVAVRDTDPTTRIGKEGRYLVDIEWAVINGDRTRVVKGEVLQPAEEIFISPGLGDFTMADLPDGCDLGNGNSGPLAVVVSRSGVDDTVVYINVVVFPPTTVLTAEQKSKLCEIFEGKP
jgi:hypothetical protein